MIHASMTPRHHQPAAHRYACSTLAPSLRSNSLEGAAHRLERETAVFFDVFHLQHLARSACWDELTAYVNRFMPFDPNPPSREASSFLRCIHIYQMLGKIAAGGKHAEYVSTMCPLLSAAAAKAHPRVAALHAFFHQVLQRPPRNFSDWRQIWAVAAESLKDLALGCPELKGKLHLPHHAPKCWQINLSGVRPVLRPYVKKVNQQKAHDVAYLFEEKRREILGSLSEFSCNETSDSLLYDMQVVPPVQSTKRARSQDDCCTGTSYYDPTECSKRPRRSVDADVCFSEQKQENDFSRKVTSVEELRERCVSTFEDSMNVEILSMIL